MPARGAWAHPRGRRLAILRVVDLTDLAEPFDNGATALLRTDFSDDAVWRRVVAEVRQPVLFDGSPYGPYEPNVVAVDARDLEGATADSLARDLADLADVRGYVLLADARTMAEADTGGELTVLYVDLSVTDEEDAALLETFLGRSFRCAVTELASIEANLSIANMDFRDFADSVESDGVFRGFPAQ